MGTLTNFATTELVDHVFNAAYTPIATLYVALCTNTLDATDVANTDLTETDYSGYARTTISFGGASARAITQDADIEFPQAGGASGSDITDWAIIDSSSGVGNVLAFGEFNGVGWNTVNGNTPKIVSGEIIVSFGASTNGFTDVCVHKMLELMFDNTAWTSPNGDIHFGLTTATMSDTSTLANITECSGGGYAREPVPNTSFGNAVSGVLSNTTAVTFDTPSGSWGLVTSMFVCDVLTGTVGDLIAFDNTNIVDQTPTTDDTVQFAVGAFDVDLS